MFTFESKNLSKSSVNDVFSGTVSCLAGAGCAFSGIKTSEDLVLGTAAPDGGNAPINISAVMSLALCPSINHTAWSSPTQSQTSPQAHMLLQRKAAVPVNLLASPRCFSVTLAIFEFEYLAVLRSRPYNSPEGDFSIAANTMPYVFPSFWHTHLKSGRSFAAYASASSLVDTAASGVDNQPVPFSRITEVLILLYLVFPHSLFLSLNKSRGPLQPPGLQYKLPDGRYYFFSTGTLLAIFVVRSSIALRPSASNIIGWFPDVPPLPPVITTVSGPLNLAIASNTIASRLA